MRKFCVIVLMMVLLFMSASAAQATVLVLQDGLDGYTGCQDATPRSDMPTTNGHSGGVNFVGSEVTREFETVMRWNISAIPVGQVIESAIFEMYTYQTGNMSRDVAVYQILMTDWTETGVSWNVRKPLEGEVTFPWNTAGLKASSDSAGFDSTADRRATAIATTTVNAASRWYSWDITSAVNEWYTNPSAEAGGLVLRDTSTPTSLSLMRFRNSINTAGTETHPKLTITYIPEPATLVIISIGAAGLVARRRKIS
jgi:hypothetical protein